MAGSGELYKGTDGKWAFRVKAANGRVVATDGGVFAPHESGTDVIPRSVTSHALLDGRIRTRRYAHTMGTW